MNAVNGGEAADAVRSQPRPQRAGLRAALVVVMLAGLLAAVGGFFASSFLNERQRSAETRHLGLLDDQQRLAETIVRHSPRAVSGVESSFAHVRHAREAIEAVLAALRGEGDDGVGALSPALAEDLDRLEAEWNALTDSVDLVLAAREPVLGLRESLEGLNALAARLLAQVESLLDAAAAADLEPDQRYVLRTLLVYADRVSRDLRRAVSATDGGLLDVERYGRDGKLLTAFGRAINGMLLGDLELGVRRVESQALRARLENLAALYRQATETLQAIMSNTLVVIHVRETEEAVAASAERVPAITVAMRQALRGRAGSPWAEERVRVWLAAAAFVALLLVAALVVIDGRARVSAERGRAEEARRRQEESSELNRRSQDAILRLLDEISVLADGDLTTEATVTEDATGAIADAVNYAIEALREIVANINDTSAEVTSASRTTRARAMELAEATEAQVRRIDQASESIAEMSGSVDRIAQAASESSQVAAQSVEIANHGAAAVRDTIRGMGTIRETIQETAKRLKRLGESSQEIGDIVRLIDDIAEQTSVLALNAAIQASSAGEAGRGFAVVADEVQRLAERAGQATKQIEALVKAIQSDTHEALASMEESTAGVVAGARVAEGAGASLAEIESVSQRLATRIEGITGLTRHHAERALAITAVMRALGEATGETRAGTNDTATSIGELAELADALRASVEGFRLPERDFTSTVTLPQQLAARRAAESGERPAAGAGSRRRAEPRAEDAQGPGDAGARGSGSGSRRPMSGGYQAWR